MSTQSSNPPKQKSLQEAVLLLLSDSGFLSASDDEKEDISPQETPLKNLASASALDSAIPSKRHTDNDEDEDDSKETKKEEEVQYKKPNEGESLEAYFVRVLSDEITFLKDILDYHSEKEVYPFDNYVALVEFIINWLQVDDFPSDFMINWLQIEIEKLKKKYAKVAEQVDSNFKALKPQERLAFQLAHKIWSTQSHTEFLLDLEPLSFIKIQTLFRMKVKPQGEKESMSILEAAIIILWGLDSYYLKNERYPFENADDMDDFIKKWVNLDIPADKFMQMIQALSRKYEKEVGKMLKNVGILGSEREAFNLAKKIWGNKIEN